MAQQTESVDTPWHLTLGPKNEPILPPNHLHRIDLVVTNGPNGQVLEHHYHAPTVAEMERRAPTFTVLVRIREKGTDIAWHERVGMHNGVKVPIVISGSDRVSDNLWNLRGRINLPKDETHTSIVPDVGTARGVSISAYDVTTRRGYLSISRKDYLVVIDLWEKGLIETD